jgi:hypothetical protein
VARVWHAIAVVILIAAVAAVAALVWRTDRRDVHDPLPA